jgi:hypothetical protein
MHKLAALALTAAVGVAGMAYTKAAEAGVYVSVGLPGVGLYAPYYGRPYYYPRGFAHYGYGFHGYGFRGYGYAHGGRRWR